MAGRVGYQTAIRDCLSRSARSSNGGGRFGFPGGGRSGIILPILLQFCCCAPQCQWQLNVGVGGSGYSDLVAYRVSSAGEQVWKWQGGDSITKGRFFGAVSVDDGSAVVLVGERSTSEDAVVAMKLDSRGNDLWYWEDSTKGEELWRWQGGTIEDDSASAVAVTESGDVVLAGYTRGDWTTENIGDTDFAVVMLSGLDGSVISGWQGGFTGYDEFTAIAGSSNDTVVFAGYT